MNYQAVLEELMGAPHDDNQLCGWLQKRAGSPIESLVYSIYRAADGNSSALDAHSEAVEFCQAMSCEHDSIACMIGAYRTTATRKGERYWASIGCVYGPVTPVDGDRCLDCGRRFDGREWVW